MQVQDTAVSARVKRGIASARNGHVEEHGDLFTVRASMRAFWYTVSLNNVNGECCECPDWKQHGFGHICKHIYAVALVAAKS